MGNMLANFFIRFLPTTLKKIPGYHKSKMVFLVRTDLKMGKGKIASQVAHATILLYKSAIKNKNPCLEGWLRWGQPKMVLKVTKDCENTLEKVYQDAKSSNLNVCMVHDAGETQIEHGTLTVVGIGPNIREDIDKITGEFRLL